MAKEIEFSLDSLIDNALNSAVSSQVASLVSIDDIDYDDPIHYKSRIVPMEEFCESEEYLNLSGMVFRDIIQFLIDLEDHKYREGWAELGKGSGKSVMAEIFLLRGSYIVMEMVNARRLFNLMPGQLISMVNVATSKEQAKDIVFEGFKTMIQNSKYFRSKAVLGTRTIHMKEENIKIYAGHTNDTAFLGYPTIRAVMDETNFMMDSNKRSVAQKLHTALAGSLKTRYPNFYKLLSISSINMPNSFATAHITKLKGIGKKRIILPKVDHRKILMHRYKCKMEHIPIHIRRETDLDLINSSKIANATIEEYSTDTQLAMCAPSWLINTNLDVTNFLASFNLRTNKETEVRDALRDFANIPYTGKSPFFKSPEILDTMASKNLKQNAFYRNGKVVLLKDFKPKKGLSYVFVSDLSVNGDRTGVALLHRRFDGKFVIDFAFAIHAEFGKRIDYSHIRKLIYTLTVLGFKIKHVGYDQFQSNDSILMLQKKGYDALEVSYDTSLVACSAVHQLIYNRSLLYSPEMTTLIGEAKELQIGPRRVDHLTGEGIFNSKDVWDAVVNGVALLSKDEEEFELETV